MIEEALTSEDRAANASHCVAALDLAPMPVLLDDLDDSANAAYEAWPDRLILIDREGRVAYRSAPGPFGFEPEELARAIREELRREGAPESELGPEELDTLEGEAVD